MALIDKVRRTIRDEALFGPGARILCAVSGGADSTAMLLALRELAGPMDLKLEVGHVNHGLRGSDSDADEAFVRTLSGRLELPFHSIRVDAGGYAAESGLGVEAAARELRYSFFRDLMHTRGIKYLATAHNARDNLETALFHLTRGTAVAGVAGIPVVREMEDSTVVRPLLAVSRAEIEAYLAAQGQAYVTDATNESDAYTRNYIRRNVLPPLEKLNPSLYETAASTQRRLRQDADFIRLAVDDAWRACVREGACDAHALSVLHPAVAGRLVARLYRETAPEGEQLTSVNCEAVLALARSGNPSAQTDLPSGVTVRREYGRLVFTRGAEAGELLTRTLTIGGTTVLEEAGLEIHCDFEPEPPRNFRFIHKFFFDYSHIYGILSVRARRAGDVIHLAGHACEKTLKKAMIDAKIPRFRRGLVPVICDDAGIVAVDGLGVAQRAAVTGETRRILCIQIQDYSGGNDNDDGVR